MIVCHCFCVSDREIRGCAREGAGSVAEVGKACGAGTGCGGCRPEIARIIDGDERPHAYAHQASHHTTTSYPLLRVLQTG